MTAPTTRERVSQRVPLWRDVIVLKWVTQVFLLVMVLGAMFFLANQAGDNLRARNISTEFDFLHEPVMIQISEGIDTHPDTGARALWSAMVNTLRISGAGIIFATLLGVVVALARLSDNWLVRRIGTTWVEVFRNIPLLVQMIIIFSTLTALPRVGLDSGPINGWLHISNKGISMPRVFMADGFYQWAVVVLIGTVAAHYVRRHRQRIQDETGANTSPILWALGTVALFGLVGLFVHPAFSWLGPVFGAIAKLFDSLPNAAPQVLFSAAAIGVATTWIRRFLSAHRSALGHLSLSDDDWFRMIFAALTSLAVVLLVVRWTGISAWTLDSSRDLFEVLEAKFEVDGAARPFDAMRPDIIQKSRFPNYGTNGLTMSIGFASVFFAVVFYTSAFIGENVRGGILAVPKGQTEAAKAVGLKRGQVLRHVVLPQAIRVIMPPTGNQYLNLLKNTSLAIAVGYSDIVQVGTTVFNQTGMTLPVVAIWMLFYLSCSLTISVLVNWFNVRMRLVER